jgi:MoxR-like ATPase
LHHQRRHSIQGFKKKHGMENTTTLDIRAINEKIERESAFIDLLTMEMNKVIVGQKHMVERINWTLGTHLLEGVPGLAKTLAINTLSQAVHGSFSRIQFTIYCLLML